ncbi:MAG: hypothetical protein AVO38_14800 [delta proteobacterium ML8_D]|jgi:uncharacterized membrane protein YbhN (UPF0104 family)|nr:MAG: hypothetical protein AVO38_14800 [delta proteobacterium ML8_D]
MRNWFKNILAIVILTFLFWILITHWDNLKALLKLNQKQLALLYLLCFLVTIDTARVVQCLIEALKIRTRFWDMVRLHNAAVLLNYVPMKFGTVFRANYLKRRYGLAYVHFVTFFVFVTFLMSAIAAIIGLAVLLAVFGISGYENKILAISYAIIIIGSLLFLFLPLPVPKGQGRLSTILRNFLSSRSQISKQRKIIFTASGLLSVNFLLTTARLSIIYHSMDKDIHLGGYLILGTLGFVVLFVALTPGSLGIRELVLGFGAVVVGAPLEVGILAAMIDRAVVFSYAFIVGGACAGWLWHKYPADFKERKDISLL